jgi:hypothetical protein
VRTTVCSVHEGRDGVGATPTPSIRSCANGTSAKIPTPIPAEATPIAVPTDDGNQPRINTTDGTQPAALTPSAASTPNAT